MFTGSPQGPHLVLAVFLVKPTGVGGWGGGGGGLTLDTTPYTCGTAGQSDCKHRIKITKASSTCTNIVK